MRRFNYDLIEEILYIVLVIIIFYFLERNLTIFLSHTLALLIQIVFILISVFIVAIIFSKQNYNKMLNDAKKELEETDKKFFIFGYFTDYVQKIDLRIRANYDYKGTVKALETFKASLYNYIKKIHGKKSMKRDKIFEINKFLETIKEIECAQFNLMWYKIISKNEQYFDKNFKKIMKRLFFIVISAIFINIFPFIFPPGVINMIIFILWMYILYLMISIWILITNLSPIYKKIIREVSDELLGH